MDVATKELESFCGDVGEILGAILASKGFTLSGSKVSSDRAECDYRGDQADLRFYYYRPDLEVNCLIRCSSHSDWRYLTAHVDYGRGWTDEELAHATDNDGSIRDSLRFYGPLIGALD